MSETTAPYVLGALAGLGLGDRGALLAIAAAAVACLLCVTTATRRATRDAASLGR